MLTTNPIHTMSKNKASFPKFDPANPQPGQRIPSGGIFSAELPFSDLKDKFGEHHRLKVFAHKTCTCHKCGRVGTKLIESRTFDGKHTHRDVYSTDMVLMTTFVTPESGYQGKKQNAPIEAQDVLCALCHKENQKAFFDSIRPAKEADIYGDTFQ